MTDQPQPLILASSQPFRRELQGKLRLSFQPHSPDSDERPRPRATPTEPQLRLERDKAAAPAHTPPDAPPSRRATVGVMDSDRSGPRAGADAARGSLGRKPRRAVASARAEAGIVLRRVPASEGAACERERVERRRGRRCARGRLLEVRRRRTRASHGRAPRG